MGAALADLSERQKGIANRCHCLNYMNTELSVTHLVIFALASYRLSTMLADVNRSGPWGLLDKIRYLAGVRFDQYSQPYATTGLADGLLCIYCSSVWFGIVFTILYVLMKDIALYLALPFALSGAAILLNQIKNDSD